MSLPCHPVSSLDEIQERCSEVFKMPEFQLIGWVGVFGSFSRDQQTVKSDVDFLVGFKEGTSSDQIYDMEDLKEPLCQATQRDVDILYMRTKQPLSFIQAQALATGKTIYEVDAWLDDNRPRAKELIVDTHARFNSAVLLAADISQLAAGTTKEDTSTFEELIDLVTKLTHTLLPHDPDAECFNSFFDPAYTWTFKVSGILQRHERGVQGLNEEGRQLLLQSLTETLPKQMSILTKFYLPVLKKALDRSQMQNDRGEALSS